MPILPSPPAPPLRPKDSSSASEAWSILSWVGIAFVVMGFTDIALGWYPASFGNAEWEFGAISAALNGFALPTLGLYLILSSTVALRRAVAGRVLAILLFVLVLVILGLALTYVTVVPLALSSVAADALLTAGMRKAIVKAGLLFVAYGVLFSLGGIRAWRAGK
jgi:hypothetical protein